MLELTAGVRITRSEQMRGIIRASDSQFRTRYLEDIARQLAQTLMKTPGAVEIKEEMDPSTGDIVMRARCVVATKGETYGRGVMTATQAEKLREVDDRMAELIRQDMEMSLKKAEYEATMKAMMPMYIGEYPKEPGASKYVPGATFEPFGTTVKFEPNITLEQVEKAYREMESMKYNPISFLKGRVDRKKGRDEAIEESKARVRADNEIRKVTKKPGEALPVVKGRIRRIQMPEEAK